MSDNAIETMNVKGLDQLLKALKEKPPVARVGILGSHNNRESKDSKGKHIPSNAEIGAAHEFGTSSLPQRSFLRVPISERLGKEMENENILTEERMRQVIKEGSVKPWLTEVAAIAVKIVQGAFASGGYGKWPAWKTKNYKNNTGDILVDTHQLRDSITDEVK